MKSIVKVALALTVAAVVAQPASAQIIRNPGGTQVIRDGNGNVIRQDGSVVDRNGNIILRDGTIIDGRTGQVIGRTGNSRYPTGTRYPTTTRPGDNRMRVYTDAQGCRVKEQQKRNGDYRYERKCKGQRDQYRDNNGPWRVLGQSNDGRYDGRYSRDDDNDDRYEDRSSDRGRGGPPEWAGRGKGHGKGHGKHD